MLEKDLIKVLINKSINYYRLSLILFNLNHDIRLNLVYQNTPIQTL